MEEWREEQTKHALRNLTTTRAVHMTLLNAKKLISDPAHHETEQGLYAVDSSGDAVDPDDPSAVKWCAFGAVAKSAMADIDRVHTGGHPAGVVLDNAFYDMFDRSPIDVNDSEPHEDTIMGFDHAINLTEKRLGEFSTKR